MKLFALAAIIATYAVSAIQVYIYHSCVTVYAQISLQAAPAEADLRAIVVYPQENFRGHGVLIKFEPETCIDIRPHTMTPIKSIEMPGGYGCTFWR